MKLIVGLGNPGERYQRTRHNIGFMVAEQFLKNFETVSKTVWEDSKRLKSDIIEIIWQPRYRREEKVILAKPKTYMNNSGLAIQLLTAYYKLLTTDIWIIHDDIDLSLGAMRIRFSGASAGHHGVSSIIEKLGADKFWRFRMGIGVEDRGWKVEGRKLKSVEDFVLGKFRGSERGKARELIKRGAKAIEMALEEGLERAMNRFNTK